MFLTCPRNNNFVNENKIQTDIHGSHDVAHHRHHIATFSGLSTPNDS